MILKFVGFHLNVAKKFWTVHEELSLMPATYFEQPLSMTIINIATYLHFSKSVTLQTKSFPFPFLL